VLALGRGRIDGASARDHEARTRGCFEPHGGIHQWPDGRLHEAFRLQEPQALRQHLGGIASVTGYGKGLAFFMVHS